MLTLHKITQLSQTFVKWTSIILGGFLLIYLLIRIGTAVKEYFYPTPLPPPTVSFGKLPSLQFPPDATDKKLTYGINTLTGTLPTFLDRASVYKTFSPSPNLLALQRARERVASAGFSYNETPLSSTLYQWNDLSFTKKLTFDILTYNFDLTSNFLLDPETSQNKNVPTEKKAIEIAQTLFSTLSFIPPDIDSTKTKTTLLSVENGIIVKASSFSKANLIRVDFFQKDINELLVFYPHPPTSNINALVTSEKRDREIAEAHFFYQSIIQENSATYPIKTAAEALEELKQGEGFIASYFGTESNININNVSLGYYAPDKLSVYILPVIVFEGNNGFFAYVSAIKNEWVE